jgi:serine/threonine protein kinase
MYPSAHCKAVTHSLTVCLPLLTIICRVYKQQQQQQYFYLVMEVLNGGELFDRIVVKQFYNEKEARDVLKVSLA